MTPRPQQTDPSKRARSDARTRAYRDDQLNSADDRRVYGTPQEADSGSQKRTRRSRHADRRAAVANNQHRTRNGFAGYASNEEYESGPWSRLARGTRLAQEKPHKQSKLTKLAVQWWNRLLGAASDRTFSGQEEQYAAHRTSRDFAFNTMGICAWGMVFPVLTIVTTQLVGTELAGMLSLAYVIGMLLMVIANFGVRTFQVSDINERFAFSEYQIVRILTCALMVAAGIGVCVFRGFEGTMYTTCMGVFVYKMIDGFADVYEGRLQQADKMYLGGISQTIRSVTSLVIFSLFLLISRDLGLSSVAMAVMQGISVLLVTLPLAKFETPKSRSPRFSGIAGLFKQSAPLFVALFLYSLIDNMPKFVMSDMLSYDNQLFFNALYFPAESILLVVGLIYKPLLVRLANEWSDPKRRKRFDIAIIAMMLIIVAITLVAMGFMGWIGLTIMSFMYGVDFEQFRDLAFLMLAAGGVIAGIDFLYQVITVLRRQRDVLRLYIITFAFALFVPMMLIKLTGLTGAVTSYLIVMCILFVLLATDYVTIRLSLRGRADVPVSGTVDFEEDEDARSEVIVRDATRGPIRPSNVQGAAAVRGSAPRQGVGDQVQQRSQDMRSAQSQEDPAVVQGSAKTRSSQSGRVPQDTRSRQATRDSLRTRTRNASRASDDDAYTER